MKNKMMYFENEQSKLYKHAQHTSKAEMRQKWTYCQICVKSTQPLCLSLSYLRQGLPTTVLEREAM